MPTEKIKVKQGKKSHKSRKGYIHTVGKRKNAVARVRLFKDGQGEFKINEQELQKYFATAELQQIVASPLTALGQSKKVNISVKVSGGGKKGQAESVSLGVARALIVLNEDWRKTLRPLGLLTRDARVKERKKPGLKKARRAPQWAKR
ncbi:MAG: 30S ribosomal protein S9 [Candidatus Buchananbacteria bacterium CG10_big_fil_rev_8_21_14_0_10_42_9]|uniref:Small ribosomal subunit protein uS9 n=1 Tax=Candidatus Buchananbacteria bacterium CG10_big_fil_rev_8_21_14_0_10_42_9 TaxID=1974526 RepID=A0A2H0W111_9BACT|nr:MAG: 30S ribosomal protein S9 [Candidatus Buchananbacteria bacterium CG10_big_fil_rev_8_21_14_0_10_42_9]